MANKQAIKYLNDHMIVNQDLNTEEHYTIIAKIPDNICNEILDFSSKLEKLMPENIYSGKQNLHLTVFSHFPIDINLEKLSNFLKRELSGSGLSFMVEGVSNAAVLAQTEGISLAQIRRGLREYFQDKNYDVKYPPELEDATWAVFARYKKEPTKEAKDYIQGNISKYLGQFHPEALYVCKTSNKILDLSKKEILKINIDEN